MTLKAAPLRAQIWQTLLQGLLNAATYFKTRFVQDNGVFTLYRRCKSLVCCSQRKKNLAKQPFNPVHSASKASLTFASSCSLG